MFRYFLCCFCGLVLSACAATPYQAPSNLQKTTLTSDGFTLQGWRSASVTGNTASDVIVIFIEGDGRAFNARGRASADPTPRSPLAPQLAAMTPGSVALARPCQFQGVGVGFCRDKRYWTTHRYAREVIAAYDKAITDIAKGRNIHLVGYSGGGAIVTLVAALRNQETNGHLPAAGNRQGQNGWAQQKKGRVVQITTLAGNLDVAYVNRMHQVSAMPQSLNPVDYAAKIAHIPQRHFSGADDPVIDTQVAQRFIRAQGGKTCAIQRVLPIAHRAKDWVRAWPDLASIAAPQCD